MPSLGLERPFILASTDHLYKTTSYAFTPVSLSLSFQLNKVMYKESHWGGRRKSRLIWFCPTNFARKSTTSATRPFFFSFLPRRFSVCQSSSFTVLEKGTRFNGVAYDLQEGSSKFSHMHLQWKVLRWKGLWKTLVRAPLPGRLGNTQLVGPKHFVWDRYF